MGQRGGRRRKVSKPSNRRIVASHGDRVMGNHSVKGGGSTGAGGEIPSHGSA